jgi:hypothetical protein
MWSFCSKIHYAETNLSKRFVDKRTQERHYVCYKVFIFFTILVFCKSGGLNSWDQSRSRTSLVSRPTFLKCQDFLNGQAQLSFSRSRFFKLRLFSREFDASIFLSRLSRHVEIVEICQDASRLLRFVETQSRFVKKSRHCRDLLSLKMMKSLDRLRNIDEKIQKSMHFLIEIKTNCLETPKFSDLDQFLNLDQDFLV